jgi:hypothetical protein
MHWCQDETLAVVNMLSSVDVVWSMFRAVVGRAIARLMRRTLPPPARSCECHAHEGESTTAGST